MTRNGLTGKLTITFEVLDQPLDRNTPLSWAALKSIIDLHTPVAEGLPVRDGLSAPISYESVWGKLKVSYEKFPTIEDI